MALFEIVWQDSPAALVSAEGVGDALRIVKSELGEERIFEVQELTEVKADNFVLVRRCGKIYRNLVDPTYRFCPDSTMRVFVVTRKADGDAAVLIVEELQELPGLLLWHFDYLDDEECSMADRVVEEWENHSMEFELLELDTSIPGIRLSYDYCCCQPADDFKAVEDKSRS